MGPAMVLNRPWPITRPAGYPSEHTSGYTSGYTSGSWTGYWLAAGWLLASGGRPGTDKT